MTKSGISGGRQSIKVFPGTLCIKEARLSNAEGALVFKEIDKAMVDLMLLFPWCVEC